MFPTTLLLGLAICFSTHAHNLLLPDVEEDPATESALELIEDPVTDRKGDHKPDRKTEAGLSKCRNCGPAKTVEKKVGDVTAVARSTCNMAAVTARARAIGAGTSSRGLCLPSVRRAFQEAGCAVPAGFAVNAMHAFSELKKSSWRCQSGGTAAAAPDGAVIFSQGCGSHHTEIKSNNCYYSDFHHTDCLASSEYVGCAYRQLGWCKP